MLEYIKGKVEEITPASVIVDNLGIGYMLNISLTTYDDLMRDKEQGDVKVLVHEAIREDAHVLYGFSSRRERDLFLLLISVSGVGPNTARVILSSLTPADLEQTIATGNVASLKAVKGIGAKTAQRIIVDLKDKINVAQSSMSDIVPGATNSSGAVFDESLAALQMLGFPQSAVAKVLKQIFKTNPGATVEEVIKLALKML